MDVDDTRPSKGETQLPVKKNRGKRQQEKAMQTKEHAARRDNRNLNFYLKKFYTYYSVVMVFPFIIKINPVCISLLSFTLNAFMLSPSLVLTLSHMDSVRALGDLPPSEGDIDDVLALKSGLVGASVAAVAFILNTALNSALLSTGVHNDHLDLSYSST